ncbi:hypothetical protein MKX01_028005 [Papaver californicum]|nr:hypothetical protein MKX01_028005 [Papaver californicum]
MEATTPTAITSLNDDTTTQEYVQEVPLESQTCLVDGEEVAETVVTLDENDADVHAIMAQKLPKYVIIQSNDSNKYLRLYTQNSVETALRFYGDYSFDLETRFEVIPATKGTGLVHIRSLQNNKYWFWEGNENGFVTATAPIFLKSDDNRILSLLHVRTGYYVVSNPIQSGLLTLSRIKNYDLCTFLDWESIVVLPDLIRIKGVKSGNHLKAFEDGFMDFNRQADNSSVFDYEVSPSRNGGIRLKSTSFGKYWMDMDYSDWVLLKQDSSTVHDTKTVFFPTIVDGNRIIMRSLQSNYFCNMHSADNKENCLATLNNYPDDWSYMVIEEPVISRKIENVRYHLNDARIYNKKSVALISDDSSNKTPNPLTSELNLKTTVTNTTNWSTSVFLTVGVKMSITVGIPDIGSGEIEISGAVTKSSEWGETVTESLEVGSVKTITVPSMARLKASLMATRVSYDIPFSYTQRDVLKNGGTKVTEKNDGLFTGQNGYGYRYDVIPLPLE